jgi:hypothetical protein
MYTWSLAQQRIQKIATDKTGMGFSYHHVSRVHIGSSDVSSIKSGPTAPFIKLEKLHFMHFYFLICGCGG